jgi:arginine N-succinyltransferase
MVFIRPVANADLEQLEELAGLAGVGLTTLPKDRQLLSKRIARSLRSFEKQVDRPGGESYLLVMVDPDANTPPDGKVIGACGIYSKVGGFQPFYSYRIENALFESKQISVRKEVPMLILYEEHDGPCEIGSLFLHPAYRKDGNGRLLQLVRFLFIAEHADWFETPIVSEIRGVTDASGHSPFWNAIGHHFFGIDFAEADRLSVVNKKFIADLMPDHPIYIPLLPYSAQQVIGQPHPESAPAVKNLTAEGFRPAGMVDIFDGGPVLTCPRDEVRSVKESRREIVTSVVPGALEGSTYMICNVHGDENFRACKGPVDTSGPEGVRITEAVAAALKVRSGDAIRFVLMQAPGASPPSRSVVP